MLLLRTTHSQQAHPVTPPLQCPHLYLQNQNLVLSFNPDRPELLVVLQLLHVMQVGNCDLGFVRFLECDIPLQLVQYCTSAFVAGNGIHKATSWLRKPVQQETLETVG